MERKKDEAKRPIHKITLGVISAAIWENDTKYGKKHTVTVEQLYKDEDDKWCSSQTINAGNLPIAEKALSKAYDYISALEEERA